MSRIHKHWEHRRGALLRAVALRKRVSRSLLRLAVAFGLVLLFVSSNLTSGNSASGNPASAAKQISKFVANGDSASAVALTTNGQIFVQVSRGGSPQNPQTFLFYSVIQFYPPVFISQLGSGLIPNGDLKGSGQKPVLNTDTSAIPGFENIVCTPDETTCGPGPVGTSRETSASAQGAALGSPFQTTFAFIGNSHQLDITIQQGN